MTQRAPQEFGLEHERLKLCDLNFMFICVGVKKDYIYEDEEKDLVGKKKNRAKIKPTHILSPALLVLTCSHTHAIISIFFH